MITISRRCTAIPQSVIDSLGSRYRFSVFGRGYVFLRSGRSPRVLVTVFGLRLSVRSILKLQSENGDGIFLPVEPKAVRRFGENNLELRVKRETG